MPTVAPPTELSRVVVRRPGGYRRLELERAPLPRPGDGEVRVRAEAIGVNYADCVVRMGLYESAKKYVGWPITPGFEVAGRVDATGPGAGDLEVGAPVLAVTRFGGYASHLVVPRHQIFARPAGFNPLQAAGFPTTFLTAWYALRELARPRPGATLLVHSAAGGVGGALLQLARVTGCRAIGVVGAPHKETEARRLGADAVICRSRDDLWAEARRLAPGGYDAIFDASGPATLRQSYEHLAAPGRLVVYGFHTMLPRGLGWPTPWGLLKGWLQIPRFNPLRMTGENRSVMAFNLSYLFDRADVLAEAMSELLGWAREGAIEPPTTVAFPLARVADAHHALEGGGTVGKLVLTP